MLSDSLLETTFLFPFSQVSSTTYSIKTTVLIKHVHEDRAVLYVDFEKVLLWVWKEELYTHKNWVVS